MIDIGNRVTTGETVWRVVDRLGSGGEGDVYELLADDGRRKALKWYHGHTSTPARRAHIASLVTSGAPAANFLWPEGLIDEPSSGRFGYVMALRPPDYAGLAALLRGQVRRDERSVLTFAQELAVSFMALHLRGLCYRDINFGNAFMHPQTGHALICDNDNVGIDGVSEAMVLGTRRFMAPEIVRRRALPSKYTDRYSLAVMLFYLLVVHHPLDGRRTEAGLLDPAAEVLHYGESPLFCFDPDDEANRPDPDHHAHVPRLWSNLPSRLRDLFIQSFTEGLHDPRWRVVDTEWAKALSEALTGYLPCVSCGRPTFLEDGCAPARCPHCLTDMGPVHVMDVGDVRIPVSVGTNLTSHHVTGDLDHRTVIGRVERHPELELFGLRNESRSDFTVHLPGRPPRRVPPGRRASLVEGATVELGSATGNVRVHVRLAPLSGPGAPRHAPTGSTGG